MKKRICGDIHGGIFSPGPINRLKCLKDVVDDKIETICVGDNGFSFTYDSIDKLIEYGNKYRTIAGNHEDFNELKKREWYIPTPSIEMWNDTKVMFVGGASSIDRHYRTMGIDWFEEEQLSQNDLMFTLEMYKEHKPDIMITHTFPSTFIDHMKVFPTWYGDATPEGGCLIGVKPRTELAFDQMLSHHSPNMWIGGHLHTSINTTFMQTNFIVLNELETIELNF